MCRQKLIKLADQSKYRWQTTEEYDEGDLTKDNDNAKRYAKAEYCVEKKQKRATAKTASSNQKEFLGPSTANEETEWATPPPGPDIQWLSLMGRGLEYGKDNPTSSSTQSIGTLLCLWKMGHMWKDCPGPGG